MRGAILGIWYQYNGDSRLMNIIDVGLFVAIRKQDITFLWKEMNLMIIEYNRMEQSTTYSVFIILPLNQNIEHISFVYINKQTMDCKYCIKNPRFAR